MNDDQAVYVASASSSIIECDPSVATTRESEDRYAFVGKAVLETSAMIQ
jgi:hypothetical protein